MENSSYANELMSECIERCHTYVRTKREWKEALDALHKAAEARHNAEDAYCEAKERWMQLIEPKKIT